MLARWMCLHFVAHCRVQLAGDAAAWEAAQVALQRLGPFTADSSSKHLEAASLLRATVVRAPAALLHGSSLQLLMDLARAQVGGRADGRAGGWAGGRSGAVQLRCGGKGSAGKVG